MRIALTEGALEVSNVDAGEMLISRLQRWEDFETEVDGLAGRSRRDQLKTGAIPRHLFSQGVPDRWAANMSCLAAARKQAGARIFEDTPVVSIDSSGFASES